ncbi:MAG: hypothetical protein IPO40_05605 [Fibrobacteres bacterium]|nr:hypothetical protein [Fibrobacterota bacterium]
MKKRNKGDHVISQGLGKFYPDVAVFNICSDCDRNHGNSFERTFLRTGFISFIRSRHHIKSQNNKRRPAHNPSFEKTNSIESQQFKITSENSPDAECYFSKSGELRRQNFIRVISNTAVVGAINLPITYDVRDICNFIEAKLSIKPHDTLFELNLSIEIHEIVSNELARRGINFKGKEKLDRVAEIEIVKVDFVVTINHFKSICYTVLKAMLILNYQVSLVQPMIEFIKNSNADYIIRSDLDLINSGTNASDDPPLSAFYHHFEWNISQDSIMMIGRVFAHRNANGLKFNLTVKSGESSAIIIPYGKVIATYGGLPHDGRIQIYRGNSKVHG